MTDTVDIEEMAKYLEPLGMMYERDNGIRFRCVHVTFFKVDRPPFYLMLMEGAKHISEALHVPGDKLYRDFWPVDEGN